MGDYDDELGNQFIRNITSCIDIRTSMLPRLRIKFNFSLNLLNSWIINRDLTAVPSPGEVPSSENLNYYAALNLEGTPSYDDVRDAIAEAVAATIGDHLRPEEQRRITEHTLADVRRKHGSETPLRHTIISLDIDIDVENAYFVDLESDDDDDVAPAAESSSSSRSLKKYEVDCSMVGDGSCCICLEEFGGRGLIKTPCSHVFHGGCIEKWLERSHICPLCRYEMPEF